LQNKLRFFFISIDWLYVDGTFKSAPNFFQQLFKIHEFTISNLHFSDRPINIQLPVRIYSDIRYQRLQILGWMFFQLLFCWFRNRHSQRSDNCVARLGI